MGEADTHGQDHESQQGDHAPGDGRTRGLPRPVEDAPHQPEHEDEADQEVQERDAASLGHTSVERDMRREDIGMRPRRIGELLDRRGRPE